MQGHGVNARARCVGFCLVVVACAALLGSRGSAAPDPVRGLPFTRSYPMDEIGFVPRSARLDFDAFGRVAVIHEGVYAVLNDTIWLNLAQEEVETKIAISNVIQARDGRTYYGGRGSWGLVDFAPDGRLRPTPLTPPNPPAWIQTAAFNDVLATTRGVYFCSWNGVVYLDYETQQQTLHEISNATAFFTLGARLYFSVPSAPLRYIEAGTTLPREVAGSAFGEALLDRGIQLSDTQALLALYDGSMFVFDGERLSPWEPQRRHGLNGRVFALLRLMDGGVAVAITGQGLFILSPEGDLRASWTIPQFQRVTGLASRESGVLWVATEDAVEKVLYNSPLTTFGQRLGLPLGWPIVRRWRDRTFIASDGTLYEAISATAGAPSTFKALEPQPPGGAWALDARGDHLLVGSEHAICELRDDGGYRVIATVPGLLNLSMVGPDACFAVGRSEIALFERRDGAWIERFERIPGVEYAPVVHAAPRSVWIEMGAAGVARLTATPAGLRLEKINAAVLSGANWTNVGMIGQTVVLSGGPAKRAYFDEPSGRFVDAPELEQVLNLSPCWINRMRQDPSGTVWATHDTGIVVLTPAGDGYSIDALTYDAIGDRYPTVQILSADEIWFSAARSLHRVEVDAQRQPRAQLQPVLVSVVDQAAGRELLASQPQSARPLRLRADQNSLSFRFFSGTYNWRRSPRYEFRLSRTEPWTAVDSSSTLTFRGLPAGPYQLEVRAAQYEHGGPSAITPFAFQVLPPWHQTPGAYALYALALIGAVWGIVRTSGQLARKRNLALEQLVNERTRQLETAMEKLNEETRHTATLAERNRLAEEIHDSLQQGLSGALLQLDATLNLPQLEGSIKKRLEMVRNMVSYTRHEVQHAVWDMESPLLEGSDLGDALKRLTSFVDSGQVHIKVFVVGSSIRMPVQVSHQLLRIAQEAVTNSIRHAQARSIRIILEYSTSQVSLQIIDDGVGFEPKYLSSLGLGHFGLRGLRNRARRIGGELAVSSSPGTGTSIKITLLHPSRSAPASHERLSST
jgi:signal transduction histidine kinase